MLASSPAFATSLARAIERHKARLSGLQVEAVAPDYKTVDALYFAWWRLGIELSLAPCASDAAARVKLQISFGSESDFLGCRPELSNEFREFPARA